MKSFTFVLIPKECNAFLFSAFAELQTDMTDLTNDLETCGIPTLDHRTYVMKVFFPGVYDHPLIQDSKVSSILASAILSLFYAGSSDPLLFIPCSNARMKM